MDPVGAVSVAMGRSRVSHPLDREEIQLRLTTAEQYRDWYRVNPSTDALVLAMRAANEREIEQLRAQLAESA